MAVYDSKGRCLHQIIRLPKRALPWRYRCIECGTRLKIASGMLLVRDRHFKADTDRIFGAERRATR